MQKLINHVRNYNEFTFDTEGEKSTKQLALIQIQTIPQQLPFFVILVELAHLPEFPSSSRANNNPTNTNINQQIIKNTNDDEITVNRCIIITINNDMLYEEISNDDNELNKALSLNNNESLYEAISDDDNEPNSALPPSDNELCVSNHDMVDDVSDYNNNNNNNL
ncbi:unnamed protein product [Rotaria sordida]|uniref:Uncharacterized protein n=1 Tax=Rotaria sordida TaxID=392033 RepID=A0A814BD09_9BILA|nr:unnamed protein product [Rotaria sordida]CAF0925242.1 unnamed protein product [Rotaria sordida]CAF0926544.1 unnamed protein product [Rotaria sordida]